jgi:hypothetical protein
MAADIHSGDIGVVFKLTVHDQDGLILSLIGATVMQIIFKAPDGALKTMTAVFSTDGSDGNMQYATLGGDLHIDGNWKHQGYIEVNNFKGHTDIVAFKVKPNLT